MRREQKKTIRTNLKWNAFLIFFVLKSVTAFLASCIIPGTYFSSKMALEHLIAARLVPIKFLFVPRFNSPSNLRMLIRIIDFNQTTKALFILLSLSSQHHISSPFRTHTLTNLKFEIWNFSSFHYVGAFSNFELSRYIGHRIANIKWKYSKFIPDTYTGKNYSTLN